MDQGKKRLQSGRGDPVATSDAESVAVAVLVKTPRILRARWSTWSEDLVAEFTAHLAAIAVARPKLFVKYLESDDTFERIVASASLRWRNTSDEREMRHAMWGERFASEERAERASCAGDAHDVNAHDERAGRTLCEVLAHAINDLPPALLEAYLPVKLDGVRYKQVAATLGITVKGVEGRIRRAENQLRKTLNAYRPGAEGREESRRPPLMVAESAPPAYHVIRRAAAEQLEDKE